MELGICKLCLFEKNLCQSHVIPKRYYKKILENESEKRIKVLSSDSTKIKMPYQDGYKYYLFCNACEKILNNYESPYFKYISKYSDIDSDGLLCLLNESLKFDSGDYRILKLYLLSILWRMSIVKNSVFLDVNLGSYENMIRQMILNDDPKDYITFPIFLTKLKNYQIEGFPINGDEYNRIVIHPYATRTIGRNGYFLIFDSFQYLIITDRQPLPLIYESAMIKETGEIPVVYTKRHIVEAIEPFFGKS